MAALTTMKSASSSRAAAVLALALSLTVAAQEKPQEPVIPVDPVELNGFGSDEPIARTYKPVNEVIIPPSTAPSMNALLEPHKKRDSPPPKQWKVKQIYKAISTNQENQYKEHCEKNNDLSTLADWPSTWASFVLSIKGNTLAESETIIREFVENLRSMRHNQLCYKKNSSLVNREDREQWPATTVVRTFLDGKMNVFKKHTEIQTGDNPDDPLWQTRWNNFVESLEKNRENHKNMKELCSQFLTAQRTKRYRRNKINN
jgi:hypothetical protein